MVGNIPVLKAREVIAILEKLGYVIRSCPVAAARAAMAADIGLTIHEFLSHR